MVTKEWETQWGVAALSNLDGRIARRIHGDILHVPGRIDLNPERTHLVWGWAKGGGRRVKPSPALFDEFLRLWNEPPEVFLRFARKWGVFRLDEDGRPCRRLVSEGVEPIEVWRHFSRRANAVLNIVSHIKQKKPGIGPVSEWEHFLPLPWLHGRILEEDMADRGAVYPAYAKWGAWYDGHGVPTVPYLIAGDARVHINVELILWLTLGAPGFTVRLDDDWKWALVVDYRECVFSYIAMQLALAVAGVETLYTCSGCGLPYVRTKKAPRADQANFCHRCGRDEALRQADRRRREKMAEARRLAGDGVPVAEIAAKLETKPASVRRWLKKEK